MEAINAQNAAVAAATARGQGGGALPPLDLGPSEIDPTEIVLEAPIGDGAFGAVYRGKCRSKDVAVKVLYKQFDRRTLEAFRAEVVMLRTVNHPNVALFMGASTTTPGKLMICTELLKTDLETLIMDKTRPLSLITRLRMAKDAALGLCWLHSANPAIIHRDVKTSNFLVDEHNHVKVCDFGLSQLKPRGAHLIDANRHARGTPLWMSPEVLLGREFDEKADIYSFALVLWQIVTRKDLFPEYDNIRTYVHAVTAQGVRPPLPKDVPRIVTDLLQDAWNADPSKRPPLAEIVARLDSAVQEVAIPDDAARMWWRMNFGVQEAVPWSRFYTAYGTVLGLEEKGDDPQKPTIPPLDRLPPETAFSLRCFHALLTCATKAGSVSGDSMVTVERFGSVISWLGAWLEDKTTFPVLARDLCRQPWFHGDLSVSESAERMAQQPRGTFLVRFSSSEPGCYTISRMADAGKISHTRIIQRHDKDAPGKFIIKDSAYASLKDLITGQRSSLELLLPCPGAPYAYLFMPVTSTGYDM